MVMTMTLEDMFKKTADESREAVARTGARINAHTTAIGNRNAEVTARSAARVTSTVREVGDRNAEVVARTGARVNAHTTEVGNRTNEVVARTGARITDTVRTTGDRVMERSDANHDDTRRVIREEHSRTRNALRDVMEWPEILFGLICAIAAGIAMWFAEKDVILKPVQWDASGNVLKYGVDTFMVIVLSVLLAAFVFFVVTWIVHAIRKRY